jgi:hypothetical protein
MLRAIQSNQRRAMQNAIADSNAMQSPHLYRILDSVSECFTKYRRQPLTPQRQANAVQPIPVVNT